MRKFGTAVLGIVLIASVAKAQPPAQAQPAQPQPVQTPPAQTPLAQAQAVVQPQGRIRTLDKIAGVVGSSIILESDIELKYASYLAAGNAPSEDIKCQILQSLITQKLLAKR